MSELRDVVVFCTHGGQETDIATLVMAHDLPDVEWTLALVQGHGGSFTELTAELVDDRALPTFASPQVATDLDKTGRLRHRYRLSCDCGETLPAREDKLQACGAQLVGHGASRVPISLLRRMLALS